MENSIKLLSVINNVSGKTGISKKEIIVNITEAFKRLLEKDNPDVDAEVLIDPITGELSITQKFTVKEIIEDSLNEINVNDPVLNNKYKDGDTYTKEMDPQEFNRLHIQYLRQYISQFLHESEKTKIYNQFHPYVGKIMMGTVDTIDDNRCLVEIGDTLTLLLKKEQIIGEELFAGKCFFLYIKEVSEFNKGNQVLVSRRDPGLIKGLFEHEIPEVEEKTIIVKRVVREAGRRSKVVVFSNDEVVDALGSCVGERGNRIQNIINEVRGERIDVIAWNEDFLEFSRNIFSPVNVKKIVFSKFENEEGETVDLGTLVIEESDFPIIIGKKGSSIRLSSQLLGIELDVKSVNDAIRDGVNVNEPTLVPSHLKIVKLPETITFNEEEKSGKKELTFEDIIPSKSVASVDSGVSQTEETEEIREDETVSESKDTKISMENLFSHKTKSISEDEKEKISALFSHTEPTKKTVKQKEEKEIYEDEEMDFFDDDMKDEEMFVKEDFSDAEDSDYNDDDFEDYYEK